MEIHIFESAYHFQAYQQPFLDLYRKIIAIHKTNKTFYFWRIFYIFNFIKKMNEDTKTPKQINNKNEKKIK